MKKALAVLSLLILIAGTPALADVLYNNGGGKTYGALGGASVNDANSTTNSFTLRYVSVVDGLNFPLWVPIGDTATSINWIITSSPFAGILASGTATALPNDYIDPAIGGNDLVYDEYFSIPDLSLAAGTYWLQLNGATTADNGAVFWDEAGGDSQAFLNNTGNPIPSEFFQIDGTTSATPEPPSVLLLGIALIGLGTLIRAKSTA